MEGSAKSLKSSGGSWHQYININMTFNTRKTVCMVFNPSDRCKIVSETFPAFTLCDSPLLFVNKFKYLGHIIDHSFSDDSDINRDIRTLFTRTNVLCRRMLTSCES